LGLPLLLVAALLALILIRARLARRPLGTGGAEVEDGFSFAAPAALTFWVAFVLAGIPVAVVAGIASPGGPEWGGPGVAVFFGIVIAVILGVLGGLCHGAAVYVLLRIYAAMDPPYRKGASAAAAIAVLLVLLVLVFLHITEGIKGWTSLILTLVGLPFGLSILAIAAVSLLPGARAAVGRKW